MPNDTGAQVLTWTKSGFEAEINAIVAAAKECGVCRRFDERVCRPTLGRSLFRCRVGPPPLPAYQLRPPGSYSCPDDWEPLRKIVSIDHL